METQQNSIIYVKSNSLTIEQIEAEGWMLTGRAVDNWFEKKGNWNMGSWTAYKAIMHYSSHDGRLFIHVDDFGVEHKIFEGNCPDLETFQYICKLILINYDDRNTCKMDGNKNES